MILQLHLKHGRLRLDSYESRRLGNFISFGGEIELRIVGSSIVLATDEQPLALSVINKMVKKPKRKARKR